MLCFLSLDGHDVEQDIVKDESSPINTGKILISISKLAGPGV